MAVNRHPKLIDSFAAACGPGKQNGSGKSRHSAVADPPPSGASDPENIGPTTSIDSPFGPADAIAPTYSTALRQASLFTPEVGVSPTRNKNRLLSGESVLWNTSRPGCSPARRAVTSARTPGLATGRVPCPVRSSTAANSVRTNNPHPSPPTAGSLRLDRNTVRDAWSPDLEEWRSELRLLILGNTSKAMLIVGTARSGSCLRLSQSKIRLRRIPRPIRVGVLHTHTHSQGTAGFAAFAFFSDFPTWSFALPTRISTNAVATIPTIPTFLSTNQPPPTADLGIVHTKRASLQANIQSLRAESP